MKTYLYCNVRLSGQPPLLLPPARSGAKKNSIWCQKNSSYSPKNEASSDWLNFADLWTEAEPAVALADARMPFAPNVSLYQTFGAKERERKA